MQKIFVKYFLIIMAFTVALTVLGNSIIQTEFARHEASSSGEKIIRDIGERIDGNKRTIESIVEGLDENYITRANAFAEVIAQNPNIVYNLDEMKRIAKVLCVDEVHVIDENGFLRWGNVPAYYGLDFSTTQQTLPFMPGITDKSFEMAQEPQFNGIEGKLFQYIGVARQDKPGIVQVGVTPAVLDKALRNNRIDVVLANFNVNEGEYVLAVDKQTGLVVADSQNKMIGKSYIDMGIPEKCFTLEQKNSWIRRDDNEVYAVFGTYDDYIIEVSFDKFALYARRNNQNRVAIISSILLGLIIIFSIFKLLKRVIINDILAVNDSLKRITCGDLGVVVSAKATPELSTLSNGINEMVESLKIHMAEIKEQAAELEERNENILASLSYARRIQNNLLPDPKAFDAAFQDYSVLWEPKDEVGGDIYWIKNFEEGTVLCVCDCTGHGTPGALLTMLVATALESIVTKQNCDDPAEILWQLDQRLVSTLNVQDSVTDINDGADLAILYIAKSGIISMSSANIRLFICNGNTVENIKGQRLSIGEGAMLGKEKIETITIHHQVENKYYVASDGLFDQIGGVDSIPFGYRMFKQIILENHALPQKEITQKVWAEFQTYMGDERRRDDITLMSFKAKEARDEGSI